MNPDRAKPPFKVGSRVFHKPIKLRGSPEHGGWYGTIVRMPGGEGAPPDLFTVLRDDGSFHGVCVEGLELQECEGNGFEISIQRLHETRQGLFDQMTRAVAACQRVDLGDPTARRRIEDLVGQMSASWSDAEATKLRRKVFITPELRRLLTRYLEIGELIDDLSDVIGEEPS
jgi:hypothetical protein